MWKKIILSVVLGLLATGAAFSQMKSGKNPTTVAQKLQQMEEDLTAAIIRGDSSLAEKYYADDFTLTTPDGLRLSKAELFAAFKSGDLKLESSHYDDFKVSVYGNTAVMTFHSNDKVRFKGQEISGEFLWTDVFVKRNGQWQIVATQGTPAAPRQ